MNKNNTAKRKKETAREGLSKRIGRMFATILRRTLIIVCLESVIIAGILATMYTMRGNRSAAMEYTEKLDRAMQSKVSMLEAVASGISS